jgi:hypothetical protein
MNRWWQILRRSVKECFRIATSHPEGDTFRRPARDTEPPGRCIVIDIAEVLIPTFPTAAARVGSLGRGCA